MSKSSAHDFRVSASFSRPWMPGPVDGPMTQASLTGTSGDDNFTGTNADDVFNLNQGGNDTANGSKGDDTFRFGASFTADDRIDGGLDSGDPFHGSRDILILNGDYSAGLVFSAATMTNVETLGLAAGHSYDITFDDATVTAGDIFSVKLLGVWGVGDNLRFDGSAETDASFHISGGRGIDRVTGGAGVDSFSFENHNFAATDRVNGGTGFDDLTISGNYSSGLTLAGASIHNIDVIYFGTGFDYSLTTNDGNVALGETLSVSGAFLEAGDSMAFNGAAERDGFFNVFGGDANDLIVGGRRGDYLQGNGGGDTLRGLRGHDTFGYAGTGESASTNYDTVQGFDFAHMDRFDMWFDVLGTDAAITTGDLSHATFDADLKDALNDGSLLADHAVLFTPGGGDLIGQTFLIVDADSKDGYKAGIDVVIQLEQAHNLADFDFADFI